MTLLCGLPSLPQVLHTKGLSPLSMQDLHIGFPSARVPAGWRFLPHSAQVIFPFLWQRSHTGCSENPFVAFLDNLKLICPQTGHGLGSL